MMPKQLWQNTMRIPFNIANAVRFKVRQMPFYWACIFAGLVVYPLAIALAAPEIALMAAIGNSMTPSASQESGSIGRAILVAVAAICTGSAIGILQKQLVSRYFNVDLRRWRLVSVLGVCFAFVVIWYGVENEECLLRLMRNPLGDRYYEYYGFMSSIIYFPMIQFAIMLSALQAVYLYQYVRSVWLWLAANVTAGALFFWLFVYAFVEASLMSWLVAAIVQSLLVGYAMRYLLTHRRRGRKTKREENASL